MSGEDLVRNHGTAELKAVVTDLIKELHDRTKEVKGVTGGGFFKNGIESLDVTVEVNLTGSAGGKVEVKIQGPQAPRLFGDENTSRGQVQAQFDDGSYKVYQFVGTNWILVGELWSLNHIEKWGLYSNFIKQSAGGGDIKVVGNAGFQYSDDSDFKRQAGSRDPNNKVPTFIKATCTSF